MHEAELNRISGAVVDGGVPLMKEGVPRVVNGF